MSNRRSSSDIVGSYVANADNFVDMTTSDKDSALGEALGNGVGTFNRRL